MKTYFRSALALCILFLQPLASRADALFPLTSGRPQRDGNCWAYGASHMLEARAEFRDHLSVMTHIEKSYRYWILFDRLLNSYHRKLADEGDGSGSGINDIGAFSADLVDLYQNHGFEWISAISTSGNSDFAYPKSRDYLNDFQANSNADGFHNEDLILQTEKELIQGNYTETQALDLIRTRIDQAYAIVDPLQLSTQSVNGSSIPVASTLEKLLGSDFKKGTHSVVLLTNFFKATGNKRWLRYNSGRSLAIYFENREDELAIVRASMDRGWPATVESKDHVMTALGYKTIGPKKYIYAISDSSGAYNASGVSWVTQEKMLDWYSDSTVYYDAVKDLLPNRDLKALLPEMRLPRKH